MSDRIVALGKVRAVNAEAGEMEFVVSTDQVARDGMIIRKEAWRSSIARARDNEQHRPKFTMAHEHKPLAHDGSPPILGTVVDPRWEEGVGLVAKVRWVGKDVQPAVGFWRRGYEIGALTDVSVEWGDSKFADGAGRMSQTPEIVDLDWHAVSAVIVGADPGAKKRAADAGEAELVRMIEAEEQRLAAAQTRAPAAPVEVRDAAPIADGTAQAVTIQANAKAAPAPSVRVAENVAAGAPLLEIADGVTLRGPITVTVPAGVAPALAVADGQAAPMSRICSARDVAASLKAPGADRGTLARAYTQYLEADGVARPIGPAVAQPALPTGDAYRIVWMGDRPGFERFTPKTDELFHFADSPMAAVCREVDDFWASAADYAKLNVLHHRGVLVHGPAGCGKTSLLHQVTSLMAGRGDVVFVADRAWLLEAGLAAFRAIEPTRPVVVLIEDVDDWMADERLVLDLLDGSRAQTGVLYLGTTNYLGRMSPRFLRAGRFDRKVHVGFPPLTGRLAYLTQKLGKVETPEGIARLAGQTDGCSFGDLRELVISIYALHEPAADALARLAKAHAADPTRSVDGARGMLAEGAETVEARLYRLEKETAERDAAFRTVMAEINGLVLEMRAALDAARATSEAAGTPLPVEEPLAAEAGARGGTSLFDGLLDGVGDDIRHAVAEFKTKVAAASR